MSKNLKVGAGALFTEDHQVLMSFFENNFELKQDWRRKMGIDDRELKTALTQNIDLEIEKAPKVKKEEW